MTTPKSSFADYADELVRRSEPFTCWEALVSGRCPFGHEWQTVEDGYTEVELPIATYGGSEHRHISDAAYRAFRARRA